MNYRLPNPSSAEYRDNYERTFGLRCDECGIANSANWMLSATHLHKLVCNDCKKKHDDAAASASDR